MARTRAQFLTYIKYDFKRTDKDTEIYVAYNETIRHIGNMKGTEGLKFQSWINTVAAQEDYPLPSNKCHVFKPVRIIESATVNRGYPLNMMSKADFSERYPNPNASDTSSHSKRMPVDACIYSNSILVGPLPDLATYIIELDWARIPSSQDAASDIQPIGEDWEEVMKFGVLFRLFTALGMDEEAAKYYNLYKDDDLGYPHLIRKFEDQEESMEKTKYKGF